MSEPTAYALSHHLTGLIGRKVTFSQAPPSLDGPGKQVYGIYTVLPDQTVVVVKTDLPLLASFAGVLVGLPNEAVKDRLKVSPVEELLRDAMYEVLNIASTVVAIEGRAIFQKMEMDKAYVDGAASLVLTKPGHRSYFTVAVDGYEGGKFAVFSPL